MKTKLIAFLLLVFLTGCGGDAVSKRQSESDISYSANKTADAPAPASADGSSKDKSAVTTQVSLEQADKSKTETVHTERKIIRNADLQLESTSPEESQQKITSIAESKGGFVVESQQRSSNSNVKIRDTVTMTVRVPAAKFNESLDEIRKVASRVIVETIKGQDVTEEFVDIEARLKTKKALEEQFLEIMKQGKTVQDALNVQRELANVRSEIEQIEGRKRFLENQTNLSTIKILLQTPNSYSPSSSGFFYQLGQAISSGFEIALSFILGLVTVLIAILPFLILVVFPIFLLLRYFWRRIRTKKTTQEIIEEEIKEE